MKIDFSSRAADKWPVSAARNLADLPPETPLSMPIQNLRSHNGPQMAVDPSIRMFWRRAALFALTAVITAFAVIELVKVSAPGGTTTTELVLIALFAPLFAWISFSFLSALAGFVTLLRDGGQSDIAGTFLGAEDCPLPVGRTALLVPVYNEDVDAVFARLDTMVRDLEAVGAGSRFDAFVLSDTTDEVIQMAERRAAARLRFSRGKVSVYYRHRPENIQRKPGNIAEWVRRFGGAYDYMLILDADSLMSGDVMKRLAVAMDRNPGTGLIQTVPTVIGGTSLFARWQQFAGRLYGAAPTAGLIWWSGSEGSFWGHNAIVRVKAFARSCGLPRLSGPAPFGGEIMSHDIVEAALLRRDGWAVHMVDVPEGSYEEYPPTLIDFAVRDRRWCQGNLQHLQLLHARGVHPISRLHLLMGASAYFTSPLWALLIGVTVVAALASGGGMSVTGVISALSGWLLWLTIALLFGPKLMSVCWTLMKAERRNAFGGSRRILAGVVTDIPLGVLLAPAVMVTQCTMLLGLLCGRRSGWSAQRRQVDGIAASEALVFCVSQLVIGTVLLAICVWLPALGVWMAPVVAGLMLAPLLVTVSSRTDMGQGLRRYGVFLTPEEIHPSPLLKRHGVINRRFIGGSDRYERLKERAGIYSAFQTARIKRTHIPLRSARALKARPNVRFTAP